MRVCVISSDGIIGKPIIAALSSIEENIKSILCLSENNTINDCKAWIRSQKNNNIKLSVCDEVNWTKYGKRALYIRESYIITNSDIVMVVWSGNDENINSFIQRCNRENVSVHEVLIKSNKINHVEHNEHKNSLVNVKSIDEKISKRSWSLIG